MTAPVDAPRAPEAHTRPTCRCGHDRTHFMVSPLGRYSLTGWFWVTVIGVTTRPRKVRFRCRQCGEVFDESTDPAVLDSLA